LAKDGMGVTPAERERLAGAPRGATEMDFKASALVFASLLLIVALIVAASLIARLEVGRGAVDRPLSHVTIDEDAGTETAGSVVVENQVQNQERADNGSIESLAPVPRAIPLPTAETQPPPIKK